MNTTIKHENDDFLVIPLKHVSGITSHANRPGSQKIWAIAHENGHKSITLQVFGPNSQIVSSHTGHANRPGNPKQWAIAHENDNKKRKRRVFWSSLSNIYRVLRAMQIALEPQNSGQ